MTIEEKFDAVYGPLVDEFVNQLKDHPLSDYEGIPHAFLPAWGRNYEHALVRIAIVGKETRGWGPNLNEFIPLYQSGKYPFELDRQEFQSLDFTDASWMGNVPTRESFWGFWMNVLAKTYGIEDWEDIKRRKYDCLIDSFVWGNANSIETWTSAGVNAGAKGYALAKKLSAKFDSVDYLEEVFKPHVVILTCSNSERCNYLGEDFALAEPHAVKERVTVWRRGNLLVFHAPHPNNQRFHAGGADVFAGVMRDLLVKYDCFCPLPDVLSNGITATARGILVRECRGLDKFDAIAKVAHELRRQHSCMTARSLCLEILNPAGHLSNRGIPYTGNSQGPCKLVSTAWNYFQNVCGKSDLAEDIALAFTNVYGMYAYE